MFFRIVFTFLFAIVLALFITTKTAGAESLSEYCQRTMDPACVNKTGVNEYVQSRMIRDSKYMYEILGENSTEEGETFRPVEPILLYREEDGTEYWDTCALSRKNLLLIYYGLPFERLAVAVMRDRNGNTRSVLLFDSPLHVEVIDCERDRVLSYQKFLHEGNELIAAESTVDSEWRVGTAYSK